MGGPAPTAMAAVANSKQPPVHIYCLSTTQKFRTTLHYQQRSFIPHSAASPGGLLCGVSRHAANMTHRAAPALAGPRPPDYVL